MTVQNRWIPLDGAVNVRDLGGLPTADGRATRFGRVLRSDNLQGLTPVDVGRLTGELNLGHVIDLRSDAEVRLEGPGPLTHASGVTIHHLSLFAEGGIHTDVEADTKVDVDKVLPWQNRPVDNSQGQRSVGFYQGYMRDRADSIVSALRVMAHEDKTSIVHCAAGKDRTGVVVALALEAVGVTREAIITDYAQTGDRLEAILARLKASSTYAADLDGRPADSHLPHPFIMEKFLLGVDELYGGTQAWLTANGWSETDDLALRLALIG